MRKMIVEALNQDSDIKVVGTGKDGQEILRRTIELKPDCITLDLEMPKMDGLETLRYIMGEWPTPVVILSAHSAKGAKLTLQCLECGAVDFVAKTQKGNRFPAEELVARVKIAATADVTKVRFNAPEQSIRIEEKRGLSTLVESVVVIGASTGGPQALMEIIPKLPEDLPACVIVIQHMPPNFTGYLAERLDSRSRLIVREAESGNQFLPGHVLVAPGGKHFFLEERLGRPTVMLLDRNELQRTACPSIDFAMTSMSSVFKERLVGVILTGMGRDGAAGSRSIRRFGGTILCQDFETSMIFGMPAAVIDEGFADEICPLQEVAHCIVRNVDEISSKAVQ
ncbi:MAG: chemotaxis-specific protein-glutamate methyltransferase CheB [bacterium]|nr:MAG: chemotaxis-specific protein-glutamate methyltransferase CheB [bacterium]